MAGTKSEIEKFDGDGDFSLWKRRMYAFLSVSGLKDVLIEKTKVEEEDSEEDEKDSEKKKKIVEAEIARSERCEKAMNIIFLNWLERNKHRNQSERGESSLVKDDAHDLVGLIAAELNITQRTEDNVSQGGAVQERGRVTPEEAEDQENEMVSEDTPSATETDQGYQLARDRTRRTLKPPAKLQDYHEGYILKVLGNFKMEQAKAVSTPMGTHFALRAATELELRDQAEAMKKVPYQSAVGSLMYSIIRTRPDLAFAVGLVCRYMSNPIKDHWLAVKWLLRYLRGSVKTRLVFRKEGEFAVRGYCDADYAGDADKRRSTTGMVFTVGGNPVSWRSSLQKVVALSSTESEDIALSEASREAVWLKVKIATEYNPADIFTKVLPVGKFKGALDLLRVTESYGVSNKNEVEGGADKEQGGVLKKGVPNQVKSPVQSEVLVKLNRTSTWDSRGTALL
ncbi:hypothetical protein YC2023_011941 [Brassica napus]